MLFSIFSNIKYRVIAFHQLRIICRNCCDKNHKHEDDLEKHFCGTHTIQQHFKIFNNFISENEEVELIKEIDGIFYRRRYQFDHWDGAIEGYRETEKLEWNEKNSLVLQRIKDLVFPSNTVPIKQIHVLDLAKNGYIKPHVDSIKFCGDTIAGLSLLSSSVMRLVSEKNKNLVVDCLLPRRSLYIMKGSARYDFTHEILEEKSSYFNGKLIVKDRRVSVICRNEPLSV